MSVFVRACSIRQFQIDVSENAAEPESGSAFPAIPQRAVPVHGEAVTACRMRSCFSQDLLLESGHVRIFLHPQVGGACDRMHGYGRRSHARHNGQLLPIIPEDLHMAAGHAVMAA